MSEYQMLYKYRGLRGSSREFTERILREQKLYYASPAQFNDPFDCRLQVSMEGAPLTAAGKERESDIRTFVEEWFRDEKKLDVCILSLTEVNNDILMWSHYADCHTGICLGLKVRRDNELHQIAYGQPPAWIYFSDLIPAHRDTKRFEASIIQVLTTKAQNWAYEREWRCIDFDGKGERAIPESCLTEVIFGCRTSDADMVAVRQWLGPRANGIKFFQALQKSNEFGLDIQAV